MSRFFVRDITVSGSTTNVLVSKIEFKDGVNIVHGPSNTGKSYILGCLNFMLGGSEIPFSKSDTKYDVVSITFESTEGQSIRCKRMIIDNKSGDDEVGSTTIEVTHSDLPQFPVGDYYVKKEKKGERSYPQLLLYLMGITETPHIITSQSRDSGPLTLRNIFHFFFLDEDFIFKKKTVLYSPHGYSKTVATIMSLLYLFEGKDYAEEIPNETEEEIEHKRIQKASVIAYLNGKLKEYNSQRAELQKMKDEIGDEDIESKMQEILDEITEIENTIASTNEKCRQLLEQIFAITPLLDEMRLRRDRFRILHTQYDSDIKRLKFIADGEAKRGKVQKATKCPFCDHDMNLPQQQQVLYTEAINVELERVNAQVHDLELAQSDTDTEIQELENQSEELNQQYQQLKALIEKQLKPRATKLAATKESYQNWLLLQHKLFAFDFITQEFNDEITLRTLETDDTVSEFDARKKIPTAIWTSLNDAFQEMVRECGYPGSPVARIDIKSLDAVVGGKAKKSEGKGYRAFLNTIMLFNLMKQLDAKGKYALHMLFLDSPILSLKEKDKVKESERATPGMRESLFRYLISHCGENQIVIIENELPKNVDYGTANLIHFTKDDSGQYGFLLSVQDAETT